MTINALQATQAYATVASTTGAGGAAQSASPLASPTAGVSQPDFGALLTDALQDATATVRAADQAGLSVAAGKADVVDVATAISAAEVSLEAAIAVRNRVIEAYQEIMRMPI